MLLRSSCARPRNSRAAAPGALQGRGGPHPTSSGRCIGGAPSWRLRPRRAARARAAAGGGDDGPDAQMLQDLARAREREAAAGGGAAAGAPPPRRAQAERWAPREERERTPLEKLKDGVDSLLIADFFFVVFALAWLGAALAVKAAAGSDALLEPWLAAWQWVFQPAIGVLMLGAIVSGLVSWAKENMAK